MREHLTPKPLARYIGIETSKQLETVTEDWERIARIWRLPKKYEETRSEYTNSIIDSSPSLSNFKTVDQELE